MRTILPNCRKCGEPIAPNEKRGTGGSTNVCKSCRVVYYRSYNNEKRVVVPKMKTAEQIKRKADYNITYRQLNKTKLEEYHARYREENRDRINARQRAYRAANLEVVKGSKKKRKHVTNARNKARYYTDQNYKLKVLLRARIADILRRLKGRAGLTAGAAYRLLGCSTLELKKRIENMFRDGMSWDNHAKVWHLDHVKPLAAFDLTNPEQLAAACHYTNLQPLLCHENLAKSDFHEGTRARKNPTRRSQWKS